MSLKRISEHFQMICQTQIIRPLLRVWRMGYRWRSIFNSGQLSVAVSTSSGCDRKSNLQKFIKIEMHSFLTGFKTRLRRRIEWLREPTQREGCVGRLELVDHLLVEDVCLLLANVWQVVFLGDPQFWNVPGERSTITNMTITCEQDLSSFRVYSETKRHSRYSIDGWTTYWTAPRPAQLASPTRRRLSWPSTMSSKFWRRETVALRIVKRLSRHWRNRSRSSFDVSNAVNNRPIEFNRLSNSYHAEAMQVQTTGCIWSCIYVLWEKLQQNKNSHPLVSSGA